MPEREEKKQETGNLFEKIVKENFPNLVKEIDMHIQEAQRVPNKMDAKRPTRRHIMSMEGIVNGWSMGGIYPVQSAAKTG